jgi:hypothetical protein
LRGLTYNLYRAVRVGLVFLCRLLHRFRQVSLALGA